MLKKLLSELLQKQGKWTSLGGAVKRFKSIKGRFEMTWHGTKQQSLAFSGEEGQIMKDKLTVMLDLETSKRIKGRTSIKEIEANNNCKDEASNAC